MDTLELQTLRSEMLDDARVVGDAYEKAIDRFGRSEPVGYEACAHQLCRLYNAVEQTGLRVAKAFENSIDDEKGWHSGLINRLAITVPGVRPAVLPSEIKLPLHELRGFRHVVVHAYELELDPDKLKLILKYARQIQEQWTDIVSVFIRRVAQDQGIELLDE